MATNLQVQAPRQDQWRPDPSGRHELRWWAGDRWTDAVADGSITTTDPLPSPPGPAPAPAPAPAPTAAATPAPAPFPTAGAAPAAYPGAAAAFAPMPAASPMPAGSPMPGVAKAPKRVPVVGSIVTGLGAVAAIVGAVLPWATITGVTELSISGTEDGRDGVITLALAVMILLLVGVMAAARSRVAAVFATIGASLVALVAAYDISNVSDVESFGELVQVNVGAGLWLTLVAGLTMLVGGIVGIARR